MRLDGVDGSELFGFMVALGILHLAHRVGPGPAPLLSFDPDCRARLGWSGLGRDELVEKLFAEMMRQRPILDDPFGDVDRPGDFTADQIRALASSEDRDVLHWLGGLAGTRGDDEVFESTLCAANGAGHQNLIKSMREILAVVEPGHLDASLFAPWRRDFAVPKGPKPTLRLDPADERLYALRFANPTTTADFRTELGAQALAIFAFPLLPVVPRSVRTTVTVASRREGNKVHFEWSLWSPPASLPAIRSHLIAGVADAAAARARGAFAAFRAARVSGDKGKLSFAPSEGMWSIPADDGIRTPSGSDPTRSGVTTPSRGVDGGPG